MSNFSKSKLDELSRCIQCGSCSGSCPLNERMELTPRAMFARFLEEGLEPILGINTPWFCVSCYQCMARCPKEIPVTDIMSELKSIAFQQKRFPKEKEIPKLYQAFIKSVSRHGRITEARLMASYGIRNQNAALKSIPVGMSLLKRKRLELKAQRVKEPKRLTRNLSKKV